MALFELYIPKGSNPGGSDADGAGDGGLSSSPAPQTILTCISRCAHCELSVRTAGTPPPTACPYCGRALAHTEERVPVAEVVLPPSQAEVDERLHRIYNPPPKILVWTLAAIAITILAWAVYGQLHTLREWWYNALVVGIYSAGVGLFVITRFLFAAFYRAPPDCGFTPTVSVLVPCFNEGEAIRQTIERIFATGYPEDKLEVVCVNDGSKDDSLEHMVKAQTRHPHLVIVNFEKNRGLCHGWGVGTLIARGEFLVCVDSDTFVFPGSLQKLMQGFADPTVGGISGHCDVENASTNMLTKMQDVRYFFSYKIMKAAESVFGTVSCLPGCFSAYRRTCVLAVMDQWINATVMGEHGNFADDRSLTNKILQNYRIVYDDEALATTIAPTKWVGYAKQQARWNRSYLREIWKTGKFMWRKHPVPALSWYTMMWMPLVEPFIMLWAFVVTPFLIAANPSSGISAGALLFFYVLGVFAITAVWCIHFYASTGRRWWHYGLVFTLSYVLFFSWQIYWALFTLRGKKWGTRG